MVSSAMAQTNPNRAVLNRALEGDSLESLSPYELTELIARIKAAFPQLESRRPTLPVVDVDPSMPDFSSLSRIMIEALAALPSHQADAINLIIFLSIASTVRNAADAVLPNFTAIQLDAISAWLATLSGCKAYNEEDIRRAFAAVVLSGKNTRMMSRPLS